MSNLPTAPPLEGELLDALPSYITTTAMVICGHDFPQALSEEQQTQFYNFVLQVLLGLADDLTRK